MRAENYFEMHRVAWTINGPVGVDVASGVLGGIAAEIPRVRREDGHIIAVYRNNAHILILPLQRATFPLSPFASVRRFDCSFESDHTRTSAPDNGAPVRRSAAKASTWPAAIFVMIPSSLTITTV